MERTTLTKSGAVRKSRQQPEHDRKAPGTVSLQKSFRQKVRIDEERMGTTAEILQRYPML
jgi:hypothetical protein